MIYVFRRQPSANAMVGCLLKSKRGEILTYYCSQCLRSHTFHQNYVREVSTYMSALELKLEKDKVSEKNDRNSLNVKDEMDIEKISKIIKLSPPKVGSKKKITSKKKLSEFKGMIGALGWKNKYNVDSTKSYDPSFLSCSTEVEKFHKEFGKSSKFSSYKSHYSGEVKKLQKMSNEVFEDLNKFYVDSQSNKTIKKETSFNRVNEKINKIDMFKPLVLKPIQRQPSKSIQEDDENENRFGQKINDFNQFTETLTPDFWFLQSFHSALDICSSNGLELQAYNLFDMCRRKTRWTNIVDNNRKYLVYVYNTLLQALSAKGYWNLMHTVTQWMEADKVWLNGESYAALLYCLGRIRTPENRELIRQETETVVDQLLTANIKLNDIFLKSKLTLEETEIVLGVLREVVPNFEIQPVRTNLSSSCILVKDLYSKSCNLSPPLEDFPGENVPNLVEEQMQVEKMFFVKIKAVSTGIKGSVSNKDKELFDELKNKWKKSLAKGVLNSQLSHETNSTKDFDWCNLSLYLNCLPVEKLVEILFEATLSLVKTSGGFSPTCEQLSRLLGYNVFQSYQIRRKEIFGVSEITEKLFKNYCHWYLNPQGPAMNSRQKWHLLMQDLGRINQLDSHVVKWPLEVLGKLGKCLLDIILKEVKFTASTKYGKKEFPVLYTVLRYRDGKFQEEIKCHPTLASLLRKIGFDYMCFRADEMPMLCPPKPWKSVDHGGYLLLSTKFIRPVGGIHGKSLILGKIRDSELFATFDALNALQAVPWMINENVLDVMLEIFKNGGSEEFNVPVFPVGPEEGKKNTENLTLMEIREAKKKMKEMKKEFNNHYGLWCECLYRLSLADHYRKRIFWLPQNCDFRGRVYPIPPLLNHLGSDLFRSLLIFAKGKPLGPKGLDWLKIHLINLTGTHKKRSVEDRLAYANEILPEILDSAENPLNGNKWWVKADEPWQTLAACMEIKKVLSYPNPEDYICRLPIHQDGSCNGLQHYAALGKDLDGAKSVNLVPHDVPQDVYIAMAELIEKERVKDAELGIKIAKVLEGFIQRKVVKQTIMTTVYGVTLYGAKLQIRRRLEEIPNFPQEYVAEASQYLSVKTFICLRKMFSSARRIQEWFVKCAGEICRKNDYVQWISPLGLPVLQSYSKLKGAGGSKPVAVPDSIKQKNAFPPNFIHSLDSCHMMLTALYCEQAGITFASIHDCFWTHPCTVDVMNKICREQFVSLHSQPILENLSLFFKNTYISDDGSRHQRNSVFEAVPEKGEFNLKDIINSVYFFS